MSPAHCVLEGKRGLVWLEKKEPYAVIANKTLYEQGATSRFAVVNTDVQAVESVYHTRKAASSYVRVKSQRRVF